MGARFGFADVTQTRRGSLRVQPQEGAAAAQAPDRGLDGVYSIHAVFAVTRMRGLYKAALRPHVR